MGRERRNPCGWCRSLLIIGLTMMCSSILSLESMIWMNDSTTHTDILKEDSTTGHQNQTYCFNPSGAFQIEMASWDNPEQPLMIRCLGLFHATQTAYTSMTKHIAGVQQWAWPIRSLLWSFSDLRVTVVSPDRDISAFQLYHSHHPGGLCQLLHYCTQPGWISANVFPPALVHGLVILHAMIDSFCTGCNRSESGCGIRCDAQTENSCTLRLSPYQMPCVTVAHEPRSSVMRFIHQQDKFPYEISFHLVLSLNYVQNLILGIGLVLGSARLSTWRPFHYLLGSGGGILLSVLLGLYLIFKHTRSTVGSVPGSRLVVQGGGSLALYLFPLSGVVFFNTIVQLVYSMVGLLAQLYASESTLGIPHFGKIYVMMFATMGTFLVWWYQWLSPAKVHGSSNLDESELGVTHTSVLIVEPEEEWESDELDMEANMTQSQDRLRKILQLIGAAAILHSTSAVELSLLICLVLFGSDRVETWYSYLYYWYQAERPGKYSTLITPEEYASQSADATSDALVKLQQYLYDHPKEWEKVKETSETKLRRFAHGQSHLGDLHLKEEEEKRHRGLRRRKPGFLTSWLPWSR